MSRLVSSILYSLRDFAADRRDKPPANLRAFNVLATAVREDSHRITRQMTDTVSTIHYIQVLENIVRG